LNTTLFWEWFIENNIRYLNLDNISEEEEKEKLLDDFLFHLHQYCDKLFFQIGGDVNGKRELIISAEGDINYFAEVEKLVAEAPKLEYWEIIAFKPARGPGFVTKYGDIEIATSKVWFLPLKNENEKGLGLRLYVKDYDSQKELQYLEAAYQMLDNILGEKICGENIKYVEVEKLIPGRSKKDLFEFNDLPEYIEWSNTRNK
jgi:hypothetical protein